MGKWWMRVRKESDALSFRGVVPGRQMKAKAGAKVNCSGTTYNEG